jgi:hypothetical protein
MSMAEITTIIMGTVTRCLVQTLMVVKHLYPSSSAEGVIYNSNVTIADRFPVEIVGNNRETRD